MLYNKNNVRKTNDKKVLHKVGKQWKVVSIALLMAIGGGAAVAATNNNANADVNVNDANAVNQEAAELENDTFTPTSVSASSSAASKSTAAPSLASYSYAPSARVSGHNADAAYYNNHYEFDQQEVSYYGPTVKSYVNSINNRFPEARALKSNFNSASASAVYAKSAAKKYSAVSANPSNASIINSFAAKNNMTSSEFIDSVQTKTQSYASAVSGGSAENSAINFVNSLVSNILNGNTTASAQNASADAENAYANSVVASTNSSADSSAFAAMNSASISNESALNSASSTSASASEAAFIARKFSGIDQNTTESAAQVASNNNSSVNSSAMSSAISALASLANSAVNNGSFDYSDANVEEVAANKTNGNASASFDAKNNDFYLALSLGDYDLTNNKAGKADMLRVISDTAAQSAEATISSSADTVISAAKAYKSAHANDMASASATEKSDASAVSSASNAYAMAMANNLVATTISNGVKNSGDVAYINGLLNSNLSNYFDGIAGSDTSSYQDFAGVDAYKSAYTSAVSSASAEVNTTTTVVSGDNDEVAKYADASNATSAVNRYMNLINGNLINTENHDDGEAVNAFLNGVDFQTTTTDKNGKTITINNSSASTLFSSLATQYGISLTNSNSNTAMNSGFKSGKVDPASAKASNNAKNAYEKASLAAKAADTKAKETNAVPDKANAEIAESASAKAFNAYQVASDNAKLVGASTGYLMPEFSAMSSAASSLASSASSAYNSAVAKSNADNDALINANKVYKGVTDVATDPTNPDAAQYATTITKDLSSTAASAFNSAALASGSAKGVDFGILASDTGAFNEYGTAVSSAENSLNNLPGNSRVASETSANLSDAMSLAQSSANSSYDATVSASAKYSGDEDVNVTLASYFASSYTSEASSEANLANSDASALNSYYIDKANSAEFTTAFDAYNAGSNASFGDKTLAKANGMFVLHNSPQFITLTKNAELHTAVLFNKKTALRSAKAGEQFAVKGVAFDKVGTLRYVVGTTKDGQYEYVTANPSYVENSYLEPDADYNVQLLSDANVHASKNFDSKVIAHLSKGDKFTGHAVPTLNVDHTYNYYYGVSRLEVNLGNGKTGYVTANVNIVKNLPSQANNNNNNGSAASNNQQPAGNPANLVLFK